MADVTTYYNLVKPWMSEIVNIDIFNNNSDVIDLTLHNQSVALENLTNEVVKLGESVSSGKRAIATAINKQGITASSSDSFDDLAQKITDVGNASFNTGVISARIGNADSSNVLSGTTFTNSTLSGIAGTMPNKGAWSASIKNNETITIPQGYHNGNGIITSEATAIGDCDETNVLSGKTFSNSSSIGLIGTMPNNEAVNYTITNNNTSVTIPQGYHNGKGKVTANIKSSFFNEMMIITFSKIINESSRKITAYLIKDNGDVMNYILNKNEVYNFSGNYISAVLDNTNFTIDIKNIKPATYYYSRANSAGEILEFKTETKTEEDYILQIAGSRSGQVIVYC